MVILATVLGGSSHPAETNRWLITIASLAMFALGFADDLRPLGAKRKLAGQVLIATAVYFGGIHITQFQNPLTGTYYSLGVGAWLATVTWLVAFTNLINLIDGIDGLAAGICLMLMGLLLYVGWQSGAFFSVVCAAGICGALLGFLRYNFPPATIYLGDGGAYFLGFLAGILSMVHSQKGTVAAALLAPIFVLALPIVDVALAILRRAIKGLPLLRPDRRHLHHRLAEAGLSRTRIVLGFYGCTLFFLLLAFGVFVSKGRWLPILFGLGCAVLLCSARVFSFSREWFAVGKTLGNSLELRKQIRYALSLSHWLQLEAERSSSPEELWADFGFAVKKLGFSAVTLTAHGVRRQWTDRAPASPDTARTGNRSRRELSEGCSLEFTAPEARLEEGAFNLLSELAAESWIKASSRWQDVHQLPLFFSEPPRAAAEPARLVPLPLVGAKEPGRA
jgi:UDP-GlcNAc:undecaprenyl-phosphate GlcNAc-1-phosphate transferase